MLLIKNYFYLYLIIIVLSWIIYIPGVLVLAVPLLFYLFYFKKISNKKQLIILSFFSFILIMYILNSIHIDSVVDTKIIIRILTACSLVIYLIYFKLEYKKIYFIFISLNMFLLFNYLLNIQPSEVFLGSKNVVSAINLFIVSLLYIAAYQNQKKILMYPALIVLLSSIWASGRSGIVSSIILMMIIIIQYEFKGNTLFKKTTLMIVLLIISIYAYMQIDITSLTNEYRFTSELIEDDPRNRIMEKYVSSLKFYDILFGIDPNTFTNYYHSGNLHNSYLTLHARTGLFVFVYIIILIISLLNLSRFNFLYFGLLLVLSIRIYTDTIAYMNVYDFLLLFLLLFPFLKESDT